MTIEADTLRVLVDAIHLAPGGGLTFTTNQLRELESQPGIKLTLWTNSRTAGDLRSSLQFTDVRVVSSRLPFRLVLQQFVLPFKALSHHAVYGIANSSPLLSTRPTVVAMQNLNVLGGAIFRRQNRSAHALAASALSAASVLRAARVIAISRAVETQIRLPRWRRWRLEVVHSGMETFKELALEPPYDLPDQYFLVLASDAPHKRLEDIARALSIAKQEITVVVAGDVTAERRFELAKLAHPSRMLFLGFERSRRHIRWLLERAISLISASDLEAFPLPLVEAAAAGCPLVLTALPAHLEIASECATFFQIGDSEHLASLLEELWVRPPSRHEWSWEWSWEDNAARTAGILRSSLRTARDSPFRDAPMARM